MIVALTLTIPMLISHVALAQRKPDNPQRWQATIDKFVAEDAKAAGQPNQRSGGSPIVFVGSSSIRKWDLAKSFPELELLNRGFGGSQIHECSFFIDQLVLKHRPHTVVLYAGDNDVARGRSAAEVHKDFLEFVGKIRKTLPYTKIVFLSIKPSLSRWKLVDEMRKANRLIQQTCGQQQRLAYVDLDQPMLGKDGKPRPELFVKDGLHLSDQGYQIWSQQVRPHLGDENWPGFRGPRDNGSSWSTDLPTTWSEDTVTWRTEIPGRGWSSPVIWENQIWMGTATPDGKQMFAICVDRSSGKIIHNLKLFTNAEPRFCHRTNSYASPSPVIEAGKVYMHFGSYGTACLDSATGKVLWSRRDFVCDHFRGPGSSPLLYKNLLLLHFDGADVQYVVALDKATGRTVWKVDRAIEYGTDNGDIKKAYATPVVFTVAGQDQLVSPTSKATIAYDPLTGKEIWRVRYPGFSATARPLFGNGLMYLNTGFSKADLLAVAPGSGDLTDNIKWQLKQAVPSKPSSLLIGKRIYMISDKGIASCVDALTGKVIWNKRIGGKFSGSALYASGLIYFFDEAGKTTVIKPADTYQPVSVNQLSDGCMASPAVAGQALFVRTKTALYRIERNDAAPAEEATTEKATAGEAAAKTGQQPKAKQLPQADALLPVFTAVATVAAPQKQPRSRRVPRQYKRVHQQYFRNILNGKPEKAAKDMKAFLTRYPDDEETHYMLAVAQTAQGQIDAAIASTNKAVELGLPIQRFLGGRLTGLDKLKADPRFQALAKDQQLRLVHGPMLGCISGTSAKIWLRTAGPRQVAVHVYATPKAEQSAIATAQGKSTQKSDDTVVLEVGGLQPLKTYHYQVTIDSKKQPEWYQLRTMAKQGQPTKFRVAFGGGAGYVPENERAWTTIQAERPDVLMLLGDNVYIDDPKSPAMQHYCYYRRQSRPEYRQLIAATPVYSIWDDHDFGTNDCSGGPAIDLPAWKRPVYEVFRNNWVNPAYGGGDANPGCYYDYYLGDVHFIMLDGRYYRNLAKRNQSAADRRSTMLGPKQLNWLKQVLRQSTGKLRVLVSPVPWVFRAKGDSRDTWNGFKEERNEILDHLQRNKIGNVVLMSADRHRSDLWRIDRPDGRSYYELNSSRLTNQHVHTEMKQALFSYNKKQSFGTVDFDTTVSPPTVRYRVVNIDGEQVFDRTLAIEK